MSDPTKPPRMQTLWSVFWIVIGATVALTLFFNLLSRVWIWLLVIGLVAVGLVVLIRWLRRGHHW